MQESGVPNVSGGFGGSGLYIRRDQVSVSGPFFDREESEWPNCSYGGGEVNGYFGFNLAYVSSLYQDNLKEVRIKSIISIGLIKLY